MTFDVHQHLWPEQLVAALRRRNRPPCIDGDELILGEGTFEAGLEAHSLDARLGLLDGGPRNCGEDEMQDAGILVVGACRPDVDYAARDLDVGAQVELSGPLSAGRRSFALKRIVVLVI